MEQYAAFISYSHSADGRTADSLRRTLERFGAGFLQSRRFRIWHDEASIAMTSDLWGEIANALNHSRYLLVLLSEAAVRSVWVKREIAYFAQSRSPEQVGFILTSGKTPWTDGNDAPIDPALMELMQPVLAATLNREPFVIDLRPFRRPDGRLMRKSGGLANVLATVAARLEGKSKDAIYGEHIRALQRRVFALFTLALALACSAGFAWFQTHRAETARELERARNAALLASQPGRELEALSAAILAAAWGLKHETPMPAAMVQGLVAATTAATRSRVLARLNGDVSSAHYAADGACIVTASADRRLQVWRVSDGAPLVRIPESSSVSSAAFAGKDLLLAASRKTLMAWNMSGVEQWRLPAPDDPATKLQVSDDGARFIVTGGKHCQLWDTNRREQILDVPAEVAACSRDASWIVAATADVLRILHLDPTRNYLIEEIPLTNADGPPHALAIAADGSLLAIGSNDGTVLIWDSTSAKFTHRLVGHTGAIEHLDFSSTARLLVSASGDGTARVWNLDSGQLQSTLMGHKRYLCSAEFAPDDRHILTASGDGTVKVFALSDTERVLDVQPSAPGRFPMGSTAVGPPRAVRYFSDSTRFLVLDGTDQLSGWDTRSGTRLGGADVSDVRDFATGRDGSWLALTAHGTAIRQTPDGLAESELASSEILSAWISANAEFVLSESRSGSMHIHDFGKKLARTIPIGALPSTQRAVFSARADRVAVVGRDSVVRVLEATTARVLGEISVPVERGTSVAISDDGTWLIMGTRENKAVVWRLDPSRPLMFHAVTLEESVVSAAWSPDGRRAAIGGALGGLRLIELDSRTEKRLVGHRGAIRQIAVSSDGTRIATASGDETVGVWDSSTADLLASLEIHTEAQAVAFAPDGSQLVALGFDGRAFVFPATVQGLFRAACSKLPERQDLGEANTACRNP